MRKIKPKKEKKKNNSFTLLSKEEEHKLELALHLTNISEVTRRHISVWKREIEENDGCLDKNIMILLECIVAAGVVLREKYLKDIDLTPNIAKNPIISRCMTLCYSCFGEKLPWTEEDKEQRLPRGFMGTVGALARVIKALLDKKLEEFEEKLGIIKEIAALAGLIENYLNWIHKEITFKELIKKRVTDADLKMQENAILYKYNKAVLNGDFIQKQPEFKKNKNEITLEEINMKTDKEMIKDMLIEEKAKVEKKKAGRPKKNKEEEVVEVKEEKVEDIPVNPGHYNRFGFNTIEIIKGVMTDEGFAWSCFKDALKYLYRAEQKGGKNDYIKAKEYLKWLIEIPRVEEKLVVQNVDNVLHKLDTNWVNISIQMAENMTGAKAILTNSILRNVHEKNFKVALEQLDILLGSEE